MRLAVVCTVGRLDKYGYQNVYRECIGSMCELGEEVYLVSSTKENYWALELAGEHNNLFVLASEETFFEQVNGMETFDVHKLVENTNHAMISISERADCTIEIDVNQYVPRKAIDPLRKRCQEMLDRGDLYGWYFRRDYLDGAMFHASLRRPRIFRLPLQVKHTIDGIDGIVMDGEEMRHVKGNWPEEDEAAIVDAQLEMLPEDWEEKMNFIRCYKELEPSRSEKFEWDWWFPYMVNKYRKKTPGGEMDEVGKSLWEKRNPGYVSVKVREELGL